jgi:hypothetical protein
MALFRPLPNDQFRTKRWPTRVSYSFKERRDGKKHKQMNTIFLSMSLRTTICFLLSKIRHRVASSEVQVAYWFKLITNT